MSPVMLTYSGTNRYRNY